MSTSAVCVSAKVSLPVLPKSDDEGRLISCDDCERRVRSVYTSGCVGSGIIADCHSRCCKDCSRSCVHCEKGLCRNHGQRCHLCSGFICIFCLSTVFDSTASYAICPACQERARHGRSPQRPPKLSM